MKKPAVLAACFLLSVSFLVTGCGTANNAAKNLAKQSTSTATKDNYINNGKQLIQNGGQFQDYTKFVSAAKANPTNAQDQMNAAVSAYVNGKYDDSISYYQKAIKIDPNNGIYYNNLGNVYLRGLNQPKNALPNYEKAVQVAPNYSMAWLNLGVCQSNLGDKNAAVQTFQKALSNLPKNDPQYASIEKQLSIVNK